MEAKSTLSADLDAPLVLGFGLVGRAIVSALVDHKFVSVVVEDRPDNEKEAIASGLGVTLVGAPSKEMLDSTVQAASVIFPSPGVPDHHPIFAMADRYNVPIRSEFDLAQHWDSRPTAAITGTNGKTTVTMVVADALNCSGIVASAVGNTDVPYVAAIKDPATEVFVVECSSFRLGHSHHFAPSVAAFINFAPDHLDAHASLDAYRDAKASIWEHMAAGSTVIVNADDEVVMACVEQRPPNSSVQTFSITGDADWHLDHETQMLIGPTGPILAVNDLSRRQPHDIANALAAAAITVASGGSMAGIAQALENFQGLDHRLQYLGQANGVAWYNDSKATVPHATVAAVGGFDSVVLIAGGKNKGLSLSPLKATISSVKAVVSIGDASAEIEEIFTGHVPVTEAQDMRNAVRLAKELAESGDVVLLSPACTSFDWYRSYVDRGVDFSAIVAEEVLDDSD